MFVTDEKTNNFVLEMKSVGTKLVCCYGNNKTWTMFYSLMVCIHMQISTDFVG